MPRCHLDGKVDETIEQGEEVERQESTKADGSKSMRTLGNILWFIFGRLDLVNPIV